MNTPLRTLVHALALCIIMHAFAPLLAMKPAPAFLLGLASATAFIPFCASIAAAANADKISMTIAATVIVLSGWPNELQAPLTAGILGAAIGSIVRALLIPKEDQHGGKQPEQFHRQPGPDSAGHRGLVGRFDDHARRQ